MALIGRIQAELTGFQGAPGINSWFFAGTGLVPPDSVANADAAAQALQDFYQLIAQQLQSDVTVRVLPEIALINDEDGQLAGTVSSTLTLPPTPGLGTTPASHASMLKLRLRTDVVSDGRRIQGGPFIGPIPGSMIAASGSIDTTGGANVVTRLEEMYADYTAAGLVPLIWRRPRSLGGPLPPRVGQSALVTGVSYFTRPAVLRSRRD